MSEESKDEPKYGYGDAKVNGVPLRHTYTSRIRYRQRGECSTCGRYACQVHEQQQFVLDELAALAWPEKQ